MVSPGRDHRHAVRAAISDQLRAVCVPSVDPEAFCDCARSFPVAIGDTDDFDPLPRVGAEVSLSEAADTDDADAQRCGH
jgi:hypothetical protein